MLFPVSPQEQACGLNDPSTSGSRILASSALVVLVFIFWSSGVGGCFQGCGAAVLVHGHVCTPVSGASDQQSVNRYLHLSARGASHVRLFLRPLEQFMGRLPHGY